MVLIVNFVRKTKYKKDGSDFEKKISDLDKKIPDVSGLVKKKQILMLNCKVLIKGLTQTKQSICLLKMR